MQKGWMDYISLNNITKRTGTDKQHLIPFVVKELLDNAVDYVETFGRKSDSDPVIGLKITDKKIIISNTNLQSKRNSFNLDKLNSIFAFDSTFSSKANLYKITKGYMGDALKEVLCIPYALARDLGKEWNEPLIIKYDDKTYQIKPVLNRSEQTIKPDIKVQPRNDNSDETVIEVSLPTMTEQNQNVIWSLVLEYVILNPHISFDMHVFDFHKTKPFPTKNRRLES